MATNFSSFGQQNPVGTPGITSKQIGNGLIGYLAGGSMQNSTAPFAGGGSAQPSTVPSGLALNKNTQSIGVAAKAPVVSPSSNTLPPSQMSASGVNNYGLTPTSSNWNQLQNGESSDNYFKRTQGQSQGAALAGGQSNQVASGASYSPPVPSAPPVDANSASGLSAAPPQAQGLSVTTFPGLIGQLANTASQPSEAFTAAAKQRQDALDQLNQSRQNEAGALAANSSNPIPLEFQQGRGQVIQNQYLAQQDAYSNLANSAAAAQAAATTQQGVQQSGLASAAGYSSPQQVPYSNQYLNPLTGQPYGGGGGGAGGSALAQLPAQAQSAIQSYAQQVRTGNMTRADAESRLSAYGVVGTNALNEALGNNFNTNASNASASTTQQGQQLQTQAASANQALDTLQSKFNSLSALQTGGIPATNGIANWIAQQLGQGSLTQYNQTLHDARQQLQGVLAAAGGGTPSGYESTAMTYLPDNMNPNQLRQAIANVKSLIQQKVGSFTQSGQQNGYTNYNSGSQPSGWF